MIRSAVGIKSIKHTLCNKVLGDLKEYTTIPVSGNPLEMEFILKTVVDNKETNGIKIVVEDIEGLKEERLSISKVLRVLTIMLRLFQRYRNGTRMGTFNRTGSTLYFLHRGNNGTRCAKACIKPEGN